MSLDELYSVLPSFLTEPGRFAALAPTDSIMVKKCCEVDTTSVLHLCGIEGGEVTELGEDRSRREGDEGSRRSRLL